MGKLYDKCAAIMREVTLLAQVGGLAGWDQDVMMPPRGNAIRADQLAAMAGVIHEKATDPKLGGMLNELHANPSGLSEDERVSVREWHRDYEKMVKIPPDLVQELTRTTALAYEVWVKAKQTSDFALFSPWIEKIFNLKRREADALGYAGARYDALIDGYEPNTTTADLDPVIDALKKKLVPIVAAIADSGVKLDRRVLTRRYPEALQEACIRDVMAAMGVDMSASRMDRSAHPFCCGLSPTDVRVTTRYDERYLPQALYGVIHESGHALYEQGLPEDRVGTPLAEAVSLGIHESQSRIWENVIGRGLPFVRFLLPCLKKRFPRQLKGVRPEAFYKALNLVAPSTIRVEADEVTYNLHVLLRYELEKAMVNGDMKAGELPAAWNEKMKAYLGIRPENDAEGVLQDVHWSNGMIGYFPAYLLGNLYAAQWWAKMKKDIRGLEEKIAKGNFAPILEWLRKNIHRHGRRYSPAELVKRATGEPLEPKYFTDYLKAKYGGIYKIRW